MGKKWVSFLILEKSYQKNAEKCMVIGFFSTGRKKPLLNGKEKKREHDSVANSNNANSQTTLTNNTTPRPHNAVNCYQNHPQQTITR
ncbi:MAG: hypothetical protein V7K14_26515 [Nostoc sp.]